MTGTDVPQPFGHKRERLLPACLAEGARAAAAGSDERTGEPVRGVVLFQQVEPAGAGLDEMPPAGLARRRRPRPSSTSSRSGQAFPPQSFPQNTGRWTMIEGRHRHPRLPSIVPRSWGCFVSCCGRAPRRAP